MVEIDATRIMFKKNKFEKIVKFVDEIK